MSEKLAHELEVVREHVQSLNEKLEEALYDKENFKSDLEQLNQKYLLKLKEVETQKRHIMQMRQLNHQTMIKCE